MPLNENESHPLEIRAAIQIDLLEGRALRAARRKSLQDVLEHRAGFFELALCALK